jgi:hypothetical protein
MMILNYKTIKTYSEMEAGFTKKVFGCRYCEESFETQAGRSHHAAKKHPI